MRSAPGSGHTQAGWPSRPMGTGWPQSVLLQKLNAQPGSATSHPALSSLVRSCPVAPPPTETQEVPTVEPGEWRHVGPAVMTPWWPAETTPRPPVPPQACSPGARTPRAGEGSLPSELQAGGSVFVHLANPSTRPSPREAPPLVWGQHLCKMQPEKPRPPPGSSAPGHEPWAAQLSKADESAPGVWGVCQETPDSIPAPPPTSWEAGRPAPPPSPSLFSASEGGTARP